MSQNGTWWAITTTFSFRSSSIITGSSLATKSFKRGKFTLTSFTRLCDENITFVMTDFVTNVIITVKKDIHMLIISLTKHSWWKKCGEKSVLNYKIKLWSIYSASLVLEGNNEFELISVTYLSASQYFFISETFSKFLIGNVSNHRELKYLNHKPYAIWGQ